MNLNELATFRREQKMGLHEGVEISGEVHVLKQFDPRGWEFQLNNSLIGAHNHTLWVNRMLFYKDFSASLSPWRKVLFSQGRQPNPTFWQQPVHYAVIADVHFLDYFSGRNLYINSLKNKVNYHYPPCINQ